MPEDRVTAPFKEDQASHDAAERALVLFSGGQDSTTCLAWTLDRFSHVETVGFDYGQRHSVELKCRENILSSIKTKFPQWSNKLGGDVLLNADVLSDVSETALTSNKKIQLGENGLPTTFVPGRNLVFIILAGALAYRRDIKHLITGVCETDYSGYPDCRDDTIKAMQVAINLGTEGRFVIHTPLMWIDKAETWKMAEQIGGTRFVELIIEHTHTCYIGDRTNRHAWGYGCGTCPACELRQHGWEVYQGGGA